MSGEQFECEWRTSPSLHGGRARISLSPQRAQYKRRSSNTTPFTNLGTAARISCSQRVALSWHALKKLASVGKDLDAFSLETVTMFYQDAELSGFRLPTSSLAGE